MTDVDHRQAAIGAAALVLHEAGCGYDAAHVTGPDPAAGAGVPGWPDCACDY